MNINRYCRNVVKRITENIKIRKLYRTAERAEKHVNRITILNTAISTDNIGDEIIMYYVRKRIFQFLQGYECREIATHTYPTDEEIEYMKSSKYVLVCGTNILSPRMELYSGWKFDDRMIALDNVILIGVGWWGYQHTSIYSKFVYSHILAKNVLQSVRDSQALKNLKDIGIENVLNTNCLTTWGLEESKLIPSCKSSNVIFTLTSVYQQKDYDKSIIESVCRNYKMVYFWPQGASDLEYFNEICGTYKDRIQVVDETLEAYNRVLNQDDLDYIGSRLHGGVHALHHGKRSIIIIVDNRAREIGKDLHLPVIEINDIQQKLDTMINSEWNTNIVVNTENIDRWIQSFKNALK